MAQAKRRGYKPPANYEPTRAPKKRRFSGGDREGSTREVVAPQAKSSNRVERGAVGRGKHRDTQQDARRRRVMSDIPVVVTRAEDCAGVTFASLGIGKNIIRSLTELGVQTPFPVQCATIPDVLAGKDVLGKAQTGSGKTIAFGASLVERLLALKAAGTITAGARKTPQNASQRAAQRLQRGKREQFSSAARTPTALVLAPTRELALQIDRTLQPIARSVGLYTAQFVGGVPLDPQLHALARGIDIAIGTPGRIHDLVLKQKLDLREVRLTVIDEADHLCDLGFLPTVQQIARRVHRTSQMLLFSATLDDGVAELVNEFVQSPVIHDVSQREEHSLKIRHQVIVLGRDRFDAAVTQLARRPGKTLIFCRTKAETEQLAEMLAASGIAVAALHGNISQQKRERNLAAFMSGTNVTLVATDVAARGIHVDNIDTVIQMGSPHDAKTYVHRSGRTGRAGATGEAITLIIPAREAQLRAMLREAEIDVVPFDGLAEVS